MHVGQLQQRVPCLPAEHLPVTCLFSSGAYGLPPEDSIAHLHIVSDAGERSWLTWKCQEVLWQVLLPCLQERSSAGPSSTSG